MPAQVGEIEPGVSRLIASAGMSLLPALLRLVLLHSCFQQWNNVCLALLFCTVECCPAVFVFESDFRTVSEQEAHFGDGRGKLHYMDEGRPSRTVADLHVDITAMF